MNKVVGMLCAADSEVMLKRTSDAIGSNVIVTCDATTVASSLLEATAVAEQHAAVRV